jgi:hypothetical protein
MWVGERERESFLYALVDLSIPYKKECYNMEMNTMKGRKSERERKSFSA